MTSTDPAVQADSSLAGIDVMPAVEALAAASSVTVLCHIQPDADTIGSGLALAVALHRRGTPVQVAFAEPAELPSSMQGLPGVEFLVAADRVAAEVDLVVTVDCGSVGRLGTLGDRLGGANSTLVLDHHRSNTRFGEVNVIDECAESTTSLITEIFDAWGTEIDRDIAHCLYAGLVTDTGSFRWVRPGTHLLAERLLATGIDAASISRSLLDTHPFGWLPMLSRVLGSAQLVPEASSSAGLVYAVVRRADVDGLQSEELESVIDIVRTTSEAEIAAVFKETSDDFAHGWSVSLRSKDHVDVSIVAASLGGGGHRFSAGYTASGTVEEVVGALREAIG